MSGMLVTTLLLGVSLFAAEERKPVDKPVEATARAREVSVARPAPRRLPLVTWSELVRDRSRLLGKRVRLRVQFHSHVASWDPFVTRFGPGEFRAVRAWDDEQFPWVRTDYENPACRLFVRRGSALESVLEKAQTYTRYEVVVELHELFRDEPWVELRGLRRLERSLDEGTVIHASRARLLIQNDALFLAAEELDRALAGSLPRRVRLRLEQLRETCREQR